MEDLEVLLTLIYLGFLKKQFNNEKPINKKFF